MMAGQRRFAFCEFVCQQNTAAHLQRIFHGLQPRSERLPLVVPEVGVSCARGNDQVVVGEFEFMQLDDAALEVEAEHITQQDLHILMLGEDLAYRSAAISAGDNPAVATW